MGDGGLVSSGSGVWPAQLTRVFGRDVEAAELCRLVEEERLVTLVGAPGCGKTRLAMEVGARVGPRFAGGVRFVELAPVVDPGLIAHAVGVAVGVGEQPGRPMQDVLVDELRSADPVLVLLDNCEHVVDAAADLAQRLVTECPSVSVLTTSRAALGVAGEHTWSVPELGLAHAVELFADRARSAAGPALDQTDGAVVEAICTQLGCLPLAVELTAAWTRVLSPHQILDRLTVGSPGVPRHGPRRVPRHDTMAAAVDWSYWLLPEAAQQLFQQVSVFAGTFDLAAIEAVAKVDDDNDVLAWLTVLVDNSLVLTEPGGDEMRYRLLAPVRQHAEAMLATGGDGDAVRRRHFDHYLDLTDRCAPWLEELVGDRALLERLVQDDRNLLAALEWANRQPSDLGLRIGTALTSYFVHAGRVNDARRWLEGALDRGVEDPRLHARALAGMGMLAWRQGDYDTGRRQLEEALTIGSSIDDTRLHGETLVWLAVAEYSANVLDSAAKHAHEALDIYAASGDLLGTTGAHMALGWTGYAGGDATTGDQHMRAALEANRPFGDATVTAYGHFGLQYGACLTGDAERQRTHLALALAAMNEGGQVERTDWLWMGAALTALQGRSHSTMRLIGAADTMRRRRGAQHPAQLAAPVRPLVERVFGELSPTLAGRLVAHGRQMPWDDLVTEVLAEPGTDASPLTRREHEIAELVADGLTNVGIAQKLVISRRTVESHVDHIKHKLELTSRAEIIVWVLRGSPRSRSQDR